MQSSLTKRDAKPTTSPGQPQATSREGGDSRGLRGLDFASGARMLAPSQDGGGSGGPVAPVRLSRGLPRPNLKSRLLGSTYTKVHSENYSSSTVYEYFAQTGCAFQGTNVGTDPYTGNPRNNGRGWVTANEPGLAGLLSRICSDTELLDVNPTTARRARQQQRNTPQPQPDGQAPTTTQGQTGQRAQAPRTPSGPPPVTDTVMGFIQEK